MSVDRDFKPVLQASNEQLKVHYHVSSVEGLQSITTLIEGAKEAIMIDAPFLVPDANNTVEWAKKILGNKKLAALFVTHHHPDHFFSANPILDAFPEALFYAKDYVRAGIDREYEEKVVFWPSVYGDKVPKQPKKPEIYPYSFITLADNATSPIMLLGPVQGDSIDHTLFWLPVEKTIITGDAMYGRSVHTWVQEIETKEILSAWESTLDLIESLKPETIIPGHSAEDSTLDAKADMEYCRKYLKLFSDKITHAEKQPEVKEIYDTFKDAFPQCKENHDFFLGMLSNQHGAGGKKWEENMHHNIEARKTNSLEGYIIGKGL